MISPCLSHLECLLISMNSLVSLMFGIFILRLSCSMLHEKSRIFYQKFIDFSSKKLFDIISVDSNT